MPFGLGFFATAGAGATLGTFDLLETQVLTGNQASITFSNLASSYASTYKHLQIRTVSRTSQSGTARAIAMRINGDSGSNYSWHIADGDGSSVTGRAGASESIMYVGQTQGTGSTANVFGASIIDLLDPFVSTKTKTVRSFAGSTPAGGSHFSRMLSGFRNNTEAITSVTLYPEDLTSNFVQYSRFSLYGVKG